MTDSLPEPPELDPAALAASEFTRSRRGLEATEVRAALGRAADALRTWEERDLRLRERLDELEQRLDESHELDEQRIATVLGEETARIVTAARDAAAEIRSKAEEQAERLIRESEEQATADAEALRGEAQALRDEAARLQAEAASEAEQLLTEARTEAEQVREAADAAAATQREEAAALATSTVSDAQSRADDLLAAAELVLSERTTEAEAAAAAITAAADEQAAATEATAAGTRADADAYAAATRSAADDAAVAVRSEADAAAAAIIDEATERGRSMVAEARAVRERMLSDLAERRRVARRQLEGALAGRDRIVEVLRAATDEVSATIGELERADDEAAVAADAAAAEVDGDLDDELAELRAGLSEPDEDLFVDVAPSTASEDAALVAVAEVVTLERDDAADGTVTEIVTDSIVQAVVTDDEVDEPTAAQDAADELAAVPEEHDETLADVDADGGATVHDLFARIRAEGLDEDDPEAAAGGDQDAVVPMAAAIDLTVPDGTASAAESSTVVTGVALAEAGDLLFDRRDELLLPIEKGLARALKRLASDEQNEILDRLRRVKRGRPDPAEVLPSADTTPFVDALVGEFGRAVGAGASFWAELSGSDTDVPSVDQGDPEVRSVLEARVEEFLALHRAHLERAFAEADEADLDTAELGDRVRATYRDWRSGSLADLAGDLATAGFTLGEQRAAGTGTPWRWVVDHGGLPCADGEDNALAGAVGCGEPFPTGDVTPPAHPGCRCILAPARR
jgi:cell division septum initiation protein DivIVA